MTAVAPCTEMTLEAQSISEWVQVQALFCRDFEISLSSSYQSCHSSSGGVTIAGGVQGKCTCGTEAHG